MEQNLEWWNQPEEFAECLKENHRSEKDWDLFFMRIAKEVSKLSKCASRQIGAVLVRNNNILSIGINGSPSGSNLCQTGKICPRKKLGILSGQHLEICPAQHAEANVVAQSAKNGVITNKATIYCFCCTPCKACAGALINAGIKRVVCLDDPVYDKMATILFESAGVQIDFMSKNEIEE